MKKQLHFIVNLIFLLTISVINNNVNAQYCTPSYTSSQCNNYNMYVHNFVTSGGTANINNTSSGCGNTSNSYKFYNNMKHAGVQGTQVSFSVKIGSSYPQGVRIFVDFNIDGDFTDAGENVWTSSGTIAANGTKTGSFTIPANATPGLSRIRVRSSYNTTSFNSCNSQNYGECEDYVFEIVPSCSAKFTVAPSNTSFCENSSTYLYVDGTNADGYHWQMNTGGGWVNIGTHPDYSGQNTDSLKIMNSTMAMQNYQYRAVATNTGEACSVNSDPATIDIIPTTKSSIVINPGSDTNICEETPVIFYVAFTNAGQAPTYQWMMNGAVLPDETSATLSTTSLKDGDEVQCLFTSSAVCVFPELSNVVKFKVDKYLEPSVDIEVEYNGDNNYTFKAMPVNGGADPIYQWFRNNKPVVGENAAEYQMTDMQSWDKILVKMVSSEKCIAPENRTVSSKLATGINTSTLFIQDISLHPNPNNGNFYITGKLNSSINKEITIKVVNTLGQVVTSQIYNNSVLNVHIEMPADAANGLYSVNIETEGKRTSLRFMLNR